MGMGVVCTSPGSGGVDRGVTGSGGGTLGLVDMRCPSVEVIGCGFELGLGRRWLDLRDARTAFGIGQKVRLNRYLRLGARLFRWKQRRVMRNKNG